VCLPAGWVGWAVGPPRGRAAWPRSMELLPADPKALRRKQWCHCNVRSSDLIGFCIAWPSMLLLLFLVEHFSGYDRILMDWTMWSATASGAGALVGVLRSIRNGRVAVPECSSSFAMLKSMLLALAAWMLICGSIGCVIAFIMLIQHHMKVTDIYAPWQLDGFLERVGIEHSSGEVLMGIFSVVLALLSYVLFLVGPWDEATEIAAGMFNRRGRLSPYAMQ